MCTVCQYQKSNKRLMHGYVYVYGAMMSIVRVLRGRVIRKGSLV